MIYMWILVCFLSILLILLEHETPQEKKYKK